MDIDVSLNGESLPVHVENPHRLDVDDVAGRIGEFLKARGAVTDELDLEALLPRMVRGVAGCEGGCPADARQMVRDGFKEYRLDYIEGGILTATCDLEEGKRLEIKMFPDF